MKNAVVFALNYLRMTAFKKRIKPRVLQMPVTSRCNSRCITCNIWKDQSNPVELNPSDLKKALEDSFFNQVRLVGLNGGEPSTYKKTGELMDALLVLKKLNRVHVISNGIIASRLLPMMEIIRSKCNSRGILVYLTISIDGVGEVHNKVRGIPKVFNKTVETIKLIKAEQSKYCDVLDIGTTLSNENIAYVSEIEYFNTSLGIPAYYHPAVPNKRLHNFDGKQDFDIMHSRWSRLLATEYFYGKFKEGRGMKTRLRAFLTYYYLKNGGKGRLAGCNYLRGDVTITENLDLCLCATASDKVGNLREKTATELWKSGLLRQQEKKLEKNCDTCVHYIVLPSVKGLILFIAELLKPSVWIKYKIKALWLR